jgi:formylglycine-generating enzyme required for sulfatase activity
MFPEVSTAWGARSPAARIPRGAHGPAPAALALLALAGAACSYDPQVPSGVVRCNSEGDCPAGFGCVLVADSPAKVCCAAGACEAVEEDAASPGGEGPRGDRAAPDAAPVVDARPAGAPADGPAPATPDAPFAVDAAVDASARDAAPTDLPAPPPVDAPPADLRAADEPLPPDMAASACPTPRGGPALAAAGAFCIDVTEVTNRQYQAFLDAGATLPPPQQPPVCAWNASFVPDPFGGGWPAPAARGEHPVVSVDWCDARAFCAWAGKRLCTRAEWEGVCTNGGKTKFPYGAALDSTACNTHQTGTLETVPVTTKPRCVTVDPKVYDLSGNVEEWIDDCGATPSAPDQQKCLVVGGNWGDTGSDELECHMGNYPDVRSLPYVRRGFRCCASRAGP